MKIEDLTDFRPGDTVMTRAPYNGHSATITGEVWEDGYGRLNVGHLVLRRGDGTLTDLGRAVTDIDRPVTVPTRKYAVVVDALGYGYVRDEQGETWPWNAGELSDARIRNILNDGGRVVFEGEG